MSVDFVKNKVGTVHLAEARRQQRQLSYFTRSEVQKDITPKYLEAWAERNYAGNDDFLNWVKTVFKTDNFLSFFKYFRQPVASARLVNDIIKPQLSRVFFAEDSYFKYTIRGKEVHEPEELNCHEFNDWIFNAILFRYNDIIVVDLEDVNSPYREIISIDNVIAIESKKSVISKIAYTGEIELEDGIHEEGIIYMDDENYIFYNKDHVAIKVVTHDLGICPADYISNEAFADNDVVRKCIFSYVREEMEEYVFLKTLQRMTEPNGAIPIVTQLQTKEKSAQNTDGKGSSDNEPMALREIGGQRSQEVGSDVSASKGLLQTGTVIKVPMIKRDDGSLDMEAVRSFINFFYIPTESLRYINERIKEVKESILMTVLGDLADQTNDRKNELQVKGGFVSAEDRIRSLSMALTRVRKRTDFKMLGLKYGVDNFSNDAFYGSDFFLESQDALYSLFEKSPNPIERKNILVRLSKNRNKFNKERSERELLMYELMPYSADADFDKAVEKGAVDKVTFQLQTRFNYWISIFEAQYGDIVYFWNNTEGTNSEKLLMMNNFLGGIIQSDLAAKQLTPDEKLVKILDEMPAEISTIMVAELESEEIRSIMGKTGAKKIPTAVSPLNK
jgi:hypothetical protein